jgi:hypothetical protein
VSFAKTCARQHDHDTLTFSFFTVSRVKSELGLGVRELQREQAVAP